MGTDTGSVTDTYSIKDQGFGSDNVSHYAESMKKVVGSILCYSAGRIVVIRDLLYPKLPATNTLFSNQKIAAK